MTGLGSRERLVDALIEADRDIDMLLVPGGDHALLHRMPYVLCWTRDYFVRHLRTGAPPPYRLAPSPPPV